MVEGSGSERHGYSRLFVALLSLAILAAIAGLWWSYHLSGRLTHAEAELAQAQQQNHQLASALNETNARLKVTNKSPGHLLSARQRQIERRARELLKRQQAAAQGQNQQAARAPNGPAAKPETPGGVQALPNIAEAQLQRIKGDAGVISLIATNQHELDILKKKGDRDYYEFTLEKGKKQPVSTVALELKKADAKDGHFTLLVYADGNKIEKKDRDLNEPVQFYTGKENSLCEVVVNEIRKRQVTGYLATAKTVPAPASTP
jgi:Tfp pilus assembly protein PilE